MFGRTIPQLEMLMGLRNNGSTQRHYLDENSEDIDAAFRGNCVYYHTYYETKIKVMENLGLEGHQTLLDVGCGQGHLLRLLCRSYPNLEGVGIEINLSDLMKARHRNMRSDCEFVLCDASHLPFKDACFDREICTAVLEHVTDEKSVLCEMRRTLEDDGIVVLDVPGTYHFQNRLSDLYIKTFGVFPFHREYTAERMKAIVEESAFEIESFNTARFVGSLLFPIIETVSGMGGRKIVWCRGRIAKAVCWVGDWISVACGNRSFLKLLGGSWFFKMRKK